MSLRAPPCPRFSKRYAAAVASAKTSANDVMNRAARLLRAAPHSCLDRSKPVVVNRPAVHLHLVPEFSPGLEGVVAAETAVSEVDGANGRLIYRGGYLIEDLAPVATYEEVAYLLWHGELPSKAQLDALRHQMALARKLNDSACGALLATDPATTPMDILRTVVSAQGSSKTLTKPTLDEAIALTSIFPTIVAAAHRRAQGKDIIKPRDDLGHAEIARR